MYERILKTGADAVSMSGSGGTVFGLFSGDVPDFLVKTEFLTAIKIKIAVFY